MCDAAASFILAMQTTWSCPAQGCTQQLQLLWPHLRPDCVSAKPYSAHSCCMPAQGACNSYCSPAFTKPECSCDFLCRPGLRSAHEYLTVNDVHLSVMTRLSCVYAIEKAVSNRLVYDMLTAGILVATSDS